MWETTKVKAEVLALANGLISRLPEQDQGPQTSKGLSYTEP